MSSENANDNHHESDDKVDAIAAIVIISACVAGVVFWLAGMPS